MKKNKGGLGFVAGRSALITIPRVQGIPTPINFISTGIIQGETSVISDEGNSDCDMDNWVSPNIPGQEPSNWFSEDVVTVTHYKSSFLLLKSCNNSYILSKT